jgi:hypothetical protein
MLRIEKAEANVFSAVLIVLYQKELRKSKKKKKTLLERSQGLQRTGWEANPNGENTHQPQNRENHNICPYGISALLHTRLLGHLFLHISQWELYSEVILFLTPFV